MTIDVAVVGGGTAGAVVAARLSEDPGLQVLLLEAGADGRAVDEPAAIRGPSVSAATRVEGRTWPEPIVQRGHGRALEPYLRGRGLGGSSAINGMVAERGEPVDYDRWAGQFGLDAWSWSGVQPWFDRIALPLHRAATSGPLGDALLAAEPNARRALLARSSDGVRESTNVGYLEPARQRPNLTIEGDAIVDTVLFDGRRACGVRLAGGGEVSAATVVVCGGAIASPVLLLRSGVHRRGIGANLQDHLGVAIPLDLAVGAEETVPDISVTARQGDLQLMAMDRVDGQPPSFGLLLGGVLATHSRGHVTLDGDGPLVSLDLLHDERDRESLAAVTAWAGRVLEHPAMRAVGARSAPPDPEAVVYWHAAGTCRMGRADDDLAVVDGEGRVHGYDGLLVADASVMPFLPQAGTMLPTVMIAERIAAWLGRRLSG